MLALLPIMNFRISSNSLISVTFEEFQCQGTVDFSKMQHRCKVYSKWLSHEDSGTDYRSEGTRTESISWFRGTEGSKMHDRSRSKGIKSTTWFYGSDTSETDYPSGDKRIKFHWWFCGTYAQRLPRWTIDREVRGSNPSVGCVALRFEVWEIST